MPATEKPTLPTAGELEALWSKTADALEELDAVLGRVHRIVNDDDRDPVTYENVGVLVTWLEHFTMIVDYAAEAIAKAREATVVDLGLTAQGSLSGEEARFDESGSRRSFPSDDAEAIRWKLDRIGEAVGVRA